ncbi:MAG: divergent polysaccharide deacetylase family protein, partial [Chitinispirillia bacterium]|nr:divergent polysaccharide deacetylase family protein [Chitinispirillia bacterium]
KKRSKALTQSAESAGKLQANLTQKFAELEMRESDYSIKFVSKDSTVEISAALPRGRPIEWLMWELAASANGTPYSVEDGVCASASNCAVIFKSADPKFPKVNLKIRRSGRSFSNTARMAVIIEDFGFEATQTITEYLSFPHPLTVSLVAAQKRAPWTAQIANEYKKEVIMLLPMEPLPQSELAKHRQAMIMVHHPEERIRGAISQAASSIPELKGVSNFFGSRVMDDSRAMDIILSEVGRRRGYFVYTENARNSIIPALASKHKVPSAPIQGSIEASDSPERIREKLRRFTMAAEKTGRIIIKAPPNAAFIAVLKEELQTMSENGIKLVYVSELVK